MLIAKFFPVNEFKPQSVLPVQAHHRSWCLEFFAKGREIDGIFWETHIAPHYFSNLVANLEDLNNFKVALADLDLEDDEPLFLLRVFEHEAIRNVNLTFGKWENNEIDFCFSGVSDVCASEEYDLDLPIKIELKLKLEGISVI